VSFQYFELFTIYGIVIFQVNLVLEILCSSMDNLINTNGFLMFEKNVKVLLFLFDGHL